MTMDQTKPPKPVIIDDHQPARSLMHLKPDQLKTGKWAVLATLILAYLYTSTFLDDQPILFLPLAMGLMGLVEVLHKRWGRLSGEMAERTTNPLEVKLFAGLTLLQALALSIWGFHSQLEIAQYLMLHASFILYVAARNRRLIQGRLGILFWSDGLYNTLYLPFKHFLLSFEVLSTASPKEAGKTQAETKQEAGTVGRFILTLLVTLVLIAFVISQLGQVSQAFADSIGQLFTWLGDMGNLLTQLLDNLFASPRLLLALPISLWLFGLIGGSLIERQPRRLTYDNFLHRISRHQTFPSWTTYIMAGSLCLVYALFVVIGLGEVTSVQGISAPDASSMAVSGFWQLVRVSLLNFSVLAGLYLVTKPTVFFNKTSRLVLTALFGFAALFALLAGWKLFGIYIFLYGMTPLRLLSGWFVLVLLVWCLLVLVRLYKPIQAIRWGLIYAFVSFTILPFLYTFLLT